MKLKNYQLIPFFGNTPDNTHCNQAGMKMILGFYFPNEKYSWKKLEEITGKRKGKWTWPMKGWLFLTSKGLKVKYYGTFNYERFVNEGKKYLIEQFGKEVGNAQANNSDLDYEIEVTRKMLKKISQVKVVPNLDDFRKYISKGQLLLCNVNYFPLYGKKGYAGHFVLVYGVDDKFVYLQDPGLPPNPNAKIPIDNFMKAWNYSGIRNRGVATVSR